MADNTKIEWTDATWNPITGCKVVSPGCTNCYAMKLAGTRLAQHPSRAGLTVDTKAGPVWNGKLRFNTEWLFQPLRWKRSRRIFVCAHGDLFAEGVEEAWLDQIFGVMAASPQHIFQVLTKRPKRMRDYLTTKMLEHRLATAQAQFDFPLRSPGNWPYLPLANVWLGVSVEDQPRADERIPLLLATPATVRWISAEPLLGPVDIKGALSSHKLHGQTSWELTTIDWVVAGGESGVGARPMHPDWARSLRDQCTAADVPFFFKQWGEWAPQVGAVDGWALGDDPEVSRFDHRDWENDHWGEPYRPAWCDDVEDDTVSRVGKRNAGRLLDGSEHNAMPGGDCHDARP
ncbi:phage Gp37/Gp68 family protein [Brucella tritici]|uniref:Phage Gp37/Gp68 family protein n=1 Tax=Brucella tritici TaxID=94626 RepID=A0A833FQB7_9HYPH|nr:phage Gp37/Gp68 family protein [Brucella tritici]KAB2665179.1 phage Gp37/Gp68 family protein [Brucella tritici]